MSIEARFFHTLIRKAKARLIHQTRIVQGLAIEGGSEEAVQACDTLQTMNARIAYLCLERARLKAGSDGFGSE